MAQLLFANNAASTLAGGINNTATSVVLASGTGALFPNPAANQYFNLTFTDAATGLVREIVHVTAVSGDTLTIVRGQEGTTAVSWLAGDLAQNLHTAGAMRAMAQLTDLQVQAGNYAVDGGTANAITATLSPAPNSLSSLVGVPVRIKKINTTNSGAVAAVINGFASTPLVHPSGSPIMANELPASAILDMIYDGTNFELMGGGLGGTLIAVQRFTTAGTTSYNPTNAGVWYILVLVVGAGSGAPGCPGNAAGSAQAGGGAGAGGYALSLLRSGFTGGVAVTVGAGSAGTTGAGPSTGGTSSFGGFLSATGGSASAVGSSATTIAAFGGGFGGLGSGGNLRNGGGDLGKTAFYSGGTGVNPFAMAGAGGASILGGGGLGALLTVGGTQANGQDAQSPGAGGGGGASLSGGSTATGGRGGDGWVEVWEFGR